MASDGHSSGFPASWSRFSPFSPLSQWRLSPGARASVIDCALPTSSSIHLVSRLLCVGRGFLLRIRPREVVPSRSGLSSRSRSFRLRRRFAWFSRLLCVLRRSSGLPASRSRLSPFSRRGVYPGARACVLDRAFPTSLSLHLVSRLLVVDFSISPLPQYTSVEFVSLRS